jgi:hypothetical protein
MTPVNSFPAARFDLNSDDVQAGRPWDCKHAFAGSLNKRRKKNPRSTRAKVGTYRRSAIRISTDELAEVARCGESHYFCVGRHEERLHRFVSARWFALSLKQSLAGCLKASTLSSQNTAGRFLIARIAEILGK